MADKLKVGSTLKLKNSNVNSSTTCKAKDQVTGDPKSSSSFLYHGRFSLLAVVCSLPLVYFGGERLFGIGTLCLVAVYLLHVTFSDAKSSVIGYVISVAVMQFCILYSIGPLLWQSFFNVILLLLYNVFIVLTGGLGLVQFEIFCKDEIAFCANVEYFLFLLYPPVCLLILMWIFSLMFGVHLAPYILIILGFPICHTFLDPRIKCSFIKNDYVLGPAEKTLAILSFIFCPSIVHFLVNFSHLRHYSSWIAMCFCVSVPSFLVTFLDTTDIRDMADISNPNWQLFQVASGCCSLILGNLLLYLNGKVDGLHAVFVGVVLVCSTVVFLTVKYRYSHRVSYIACGLLLVTYITWFSVLPWTLIFSLGSTIKLSFFTTGLLSLILCVLSVAATTVSISVRYRSLLNHVLVIYTFGFTIVEQILVEATSYSAYTMTFTSVLTLYLIQRLHHVHHLTKTSSLICISLHGTKLVLLATATGLNQNIGILSFITSALGGFSFSWIITNVVLFEHGKRIKRHKTLAYGGCLLVSLTALSHNFLRVLWEITTNNEPSMADTVGLILVLTGVVLVKITFLHMDDNLAKKQSLVMFLLGLLLIIIQPYFNILEIIVQVPKVIFREAFYETWQVALAEYLILPWCLFLSLTVVLVLLFKILPLGSISSLSFHVISFVIGAPLGLHFVHLVMQYPQTSSSFLSITYLSSLPIVVNFILLASKDVFFITNRKMYWVLLFLSLISVAIEMTDNIKITILRAPVPPSVVFQGILHLIMIMLLRQECVLQTSLDLKKSLFPSIACNISAALVFVFGCWFAPKDYYDILIIPVCGFLLCLRTKDFDIIIRRSKGEGSLNKCISTLVLGLILYYRALKQLPLGKRSFWIVLGFILEILIMCATLPVFLIIVSTFWKQKLSKVEERGLALLAPVFTLLLFYGRTNAGHVLGVGGPTLAYYTFYDRRR